MEICLKLIFVIGKKQNKYLTINLRLYIMYCIFFLSLYAIAINAFSNNQNQMMIGVWLSSAAYCDPKDYHSMVLGGPGTGFLYKDSIYDPKTDLRGYIGILDKTQSIYVVLRGSSSIMNWVDDAEVRKVPYTTYLDECNKCKVHNGFYRSALGVKSQTVESVKILQKEYPLYETVVTGHSYGAAVGQLLAMELAKEGIKTKLYNYGQPRTGNSLFADFVNTILDEYYRITHNKDMVPHIPVLGYVHSCREIFEDADDIVKMCSETNCEDPACANQYHLYQTGVDDHEIYLNHTMSCSNSLHIF